MILGLGGYAGSGKNEAARGLEKLGFQTVAFADKIRESLYALNPYVDDYGIKLQRVIDSFGWQEVKDTEWGAEVRRLMQVMGTEVGRELIDENVWVNTTMNSLPEGNVTISDVRFLNEVEAILDSGGHLIWIQKPGVGPLNDHSSENSLTEANCDFVVTNDGTVDDLHITMRTLVTEAIL